MKVSKAVQEFIAAKYAANCRDATLRCYSRVCTHFVGHLNELSITATYKIAPQDIVDYLLTRKRQGLKPTTINLERAIIISFLRWLSVRGLCRNIEWTAQIEKLRLDKRAPRFLTESECRQLLDSAKYIVFRRERFVRIRDLAMVSFLLDTGVRESEMLNLKVKDIDLIERSAKVSELAKGREERMVWFSAKTARLLKIYLRERPTERNSDPLWVSRRKRCISRSRLYQIVREVAEAVGLDNVCVHSLRHSTGSLLAKYDFPPTYIQHLLGHKNLQTTMQYIHTTDDEIKARYRNCAPVDRLLDTT